MDWTDPTAGMTPTEGPLSMKRRILVVDDTPLIREHLRVILEMDGYEVETAGDGRSALAALRDAAVPPAHHRPPDARHERPRAARGRPRRAAPARRDRPDRARRHRRSRSTP